MPSQSPASIASPSDDISNIDQQTNILNKSATTAATTFDYLYEFSETRKVLEDFFKCPNNDEEKKINDCFESDTGSFVRIIIYYLVLLIGRSKKKRKL